MRTATGILALVLLAPAAPAGADERACAGFHGRAYLRDFEGGAAAGSRFYAGTEDSIATATIATTAGDCADPWAIDVSYAASPGTAGRDVDYDHVQGTVGPLCADAHDLCTSGMPTETVQVPLRLDGVGEAAVETLRFAITGVSGSPTPPGTIEPSAAPIHVVDLDGPTRASLEPSIDGAAAVPYEVSESRASVKIPVFLAGPVAPASVAYVLEMEGPAAASDQDVSVLSPNPLTIGPDRVGFIELAIVNDSIAEPAETVSIRLLEGGSAALAEHTITDLTILDNEEGIPPRTRLHHPKHKRTYPRGAYQLREFHVFHSDAGGSGVAAVQVALRLKKTNGACRWFDGKRFPRGPCGERRWVDTGYLEDLDWYFVRVPKLKPSVGTKIRHYTAFSRAIDGAGNVEDAFRKKRNRNRFEVRRARR